MIPIRLISGAINAINQLLDRVDTERMKELYHSAQGFKGRIEIEDTEILFVVKEVTE